MAGVAAGWLVLGAPRARTREPRAPSPEPRFLREAAVFGLLAALPDIDLLAGVHREPTHSITATAIVGLVAWLVARRAGRTRATRIAVACAAAYGSHVLLDWLAQDSSAPFGIMALWPFSRAYYESNLDLFLAVSRRYYQGWTFVRQNLLALGRELVILVPILTLIIWMRPRRSE